MSVYTDQTAQPGIRDLIASHAGMVAEHPSPHEHKRARSEITGTASQWRDMTADDGAREFSTLLALLGGDMTPVEDTGNTDADVLRIIAQAAGEKDNGKACNILKDANPTFIT